MKIDLVETFPCLTRREREICALLFKGRTNKQIGGDFNISARTVEDHKYSILRKIRARNVIELINIAIGTPEVVV
jgi:DNA-binding NarL/FixJ family response regulator